MTDPLSFNGDPRTTLASRVERYLRRLGRDPATIRIEPLAGDASTRVYLRLTEPNGTSWVLAVHPAPFGHDTLPQLVVGRLFERLKIPIPRVRGQAGDLGLLALEDLGDLTLQRWLAAAPPDPLPMYRTAVELVARLQLVDDDHEAHQTVPFTLAFDLAKLTWELDFFRSEFLATHRGIELSTARTTALRQELDVLARELAAEPRVVCHRDYHARNLMIHDDRLVVIDFQDARLGPATYDLVSLLRDCYVDLPATMVAALTRHFLMLVPAQDTADFPARFDLMSVQRHLKALGTFDHQVSVAGRGHFADPIPRTLDYLRRVLHTDDRFARLLGLLSDALPELR